MPAKAPGLGAPVAPSGGSPQVRREGAVEATAQACMENVWPLWLALAVLPAAAALTVFGGIRLADLGDVLADRLGLGEALFGAVFFGAVISLSGIVMTATAGAQGHAGLAFSNAIGGVAAQTVALGIADASYRRANLEHAAASLPNMLFAVVLVLLLTVVVLVQLTPNVTVLGVHPGSLVVVGSYFAGLRIVRDAQEEPMWFPRQTSQTVRDEPDDEAMPEHGTAALVARFVAYGALVSGAGWAVARAAVAVVEHTGLDENFVGAAIMGVINALPEVVTSLAAVRRGAVTLAFAGVLGGNAFDVLNVVVGDVAFRGGSIYHEAGAAGSLLTLSSILMTVVILGGLLSRQRKGPAGVGYEGVTMLAVYVATILLIAFA